MVSGESVRTRDHHVLLLPLSTPLGRRGGERREGRRKEACQQQSEVASYVHECRWHRSTDQEKGRVELEEERGERGRRRRESERARQGFRPKHSLSPQLHGASGQGRSTLIGGGAVRTTVLQVGGLRSCLAAAAAAASDCGAATRPRQGGRGRGCSRRRHYLVLFAFLLLLLLLSGAAASQVTFQGLDGSPGCPDCGRHFDPENGWQQQHRWRRRRECRSGLSTRVSVPAVPQSFSLGVRVRRYSVLRDGHATRHL